MHPSFESLEIFDAPSLQASVMNVHHDTSFRSILMDDSIFSTSKARICYYSGKGAKLWLVARPSICSFCIAHFTFTSVLRFCLDLIQPSASSLFTCECGHGLDAFSSLPIWKSVDGCHTWHHLRHHVCPRSRKWVHYMEITMVHLYIGSFITSRSLHDLKKLGVGCRCGGYWSDVGKGGFECH
jgi:hypothetical protein